MTLVRIAATYTPEDDPGGCPAADSGRDERAAAGSHPRLGVAPYAALAPSLCAGRPSGGGASVQML